jgi:hypothetical protein
VFGFNLFVCWAWISLAMSSGCVSMLLFLSMMLSNDGFLVSLNIQLWPLYGILSNVFCIFLMAFWMFLFVCFSIMFPTSYLASLPIFAISWIHVVMGIATCGGLGRSSAMFMILEWFLQLVSC